ncbi:hypothetical protein GRS48_06525 [Halorubrum sp. JWXQ-INN 858]|uniref:hypothetical protein n=1 Tax=Halorubrum sp. JWXQ-INN 858 TaxID=2690782 RepID=UPI00135AF1EE|nr:hypothetical protein [Halorubrum sp. JWXQ-INN 858]MWV64479.1 hypothetical protein [Halorubrum sp. JWXQ-INN 858]
MNEEELRDDLKKRFNPDPAVLDRVVTQAMRLHQSGQFEEDSNNELTATFLAEKLGSADRPLKESWNWWLGAMDFIADNDYKKYQM